MAVKGLKAIRSEDCDVGWPKSVEDMQMLHFAGFVACFSVNSDTKDVLWGRGVVVVVVVVCVCGGGGGGRGRI